VKKYVKLQNTVTHILQNENGIMMENSKEKNCDNINENKIIEIEEEFGNEHLNDPFNPDDISIDSKVIPMETFLRRIQQGTINLNPDFQRAEVWTKEKKSQLIESLMLNIPLPMFYVSADEKANYTVVDGLQRLSTIKNFVLGEEFLKTKDEKLKGKGFKLQDLEFWDDYNGKTFNELPTHLYNRILETEFQFTIVNPGTPEEVKRNIFKRINTGGLPLSSQEIRNSLYLGKSTELLKELSFTTEFKTATGGSIKSLRMEDKELILRFLGFLIRDYKFYKKTVNVDTFLSETMVIINAYPDFTSREFKKLVDKGDIISNTITIDNIANVKKIFTDAMTRTFLIFGKHNFRRSQDGYKKTINKCLFEMWGVLFSKLSDSEFQKLLDNRDKIEEEFEEVDSDDVFEKAIFENSMSQKVVEYRFLRIQSLINKVLSC